LGSTSGAGVGESTLDLSDSYIGKAKNMGILEEAAGAFAAVEGVKKLDPNAGILTEGVAAIAGFEGTKEVTELIEKHEENSEQQG
jgi:hypothetical protein